MVKKSRVALFPLAIAAALLLPAVCRAQECGTWTYGSVSPSGDLIAAGNGITVVIVNGYPSGSVFVSHGGGTWQSAQLPPSTGLTASMTGMTALTWGAGRFVTVGPGLILASDDGLSWRQAASPETDLTDVAWNGALFAAVGSNAVGSSLVVTSPDGLHWTTTQLPAGSDLHAIVWGASRWVALGSNGLLTSADGVSWTEVLSGVSFAAGVVGWNGSQYLALSASQNVLATSTDGIQWTVRPETLAFSPAALAADSHTWVSIGVSCGWSLPTGWACSRELLTSADGLTWQPVTALTPLLPSEVVWTGTQFLVVGGLGMATSPDGMVWTIQPVVDLTSATWVGDRVVTVGKQEITDLGAAYTSANGLAWTPATLPPDKATVALAWTGTQLVAVGPQGRVYTSPTGDVWTRQTVPAGVATTEFNSVAWSGSKLVAVGTQTALVSTDGVAWEAVSVPGASALTLRSVTWGAGKFVAVGGGFSFTSSDGLSWTPEQVVGLTNYYPNLNGIAWSGTRLASVGYFSDSSGDGHGPIAVTSVDGIIWSAADVSGFANGRPTNLFWTGVGFCAVDKDKHPLYSSADGLSWTYDTQLYVPTVCVAGNGRQLVTVGTQGITAQTDCTAPPPIGQAGVSNATIVTAANVPGLGGTQWVTDVELFNASGSAATALLYYLPRDTDNTIASRRAVSVPAGQAVRLGDVVGQLFGLSQSAGALIVSSTQPLLVTSRTATGSSAGTFGQFVPGLPEGAALVTGQEGRLIQLSENASYRTNVGFASISAVPITVTVKLYSSSGELLGTMPITLAPFGSAQVTEILPKLGVASVDDAYAVVRSDTAGAEYYAYASVVDNISGDPLTVLPVQANTAAPLYLPAVAHNPGLNSTMWRTDLEVHNPGTVQAVYKLELLESGQDNTTPGAANFMLDPGTSHRYLDVVKDVFGFEGSGAIRVTPSSGAVMATARSFTDTGSGSRGQFIPATPLSQAIATPTGAHLIQLSHAASATSGFRTNVGFVNATDSPITVQADLYSAIGTWLGAGVNTLAPFEFIQDTGIFGTVTTGDVADGFAVVTSSTANARFFAYASVIDNQSGAPVYIPAQ